MLLRIPKSSAMTWSRWPAAVSRSSLEADRRRLRDQRVHVVELDEDRGRCEGTRPGVTQDAAEELRQLRRRAKLLEVRLRSAGGAP